MRQNIRKHINFYGRVQGVGFRYLSTYKAKQLGLVGWVQNLVDGSVSMEVEGESWRIDELVNFLHHQRYIRIDSMDVWEVPLKDDRDFRVKGYY